MEVIVKIDKQNKQTRAFYEYMKTLSIVTVQDGSYKPSSNDVDEEIRNISKEINITGTKKWFKKLDIEHDSQS